MKKIETEDLKLEKPEFTMQVFEDEERKPVEREEIFGKKAILLRNLFSEKECQYYIKQGEDQGLHSIEYFGYKKIYRNNDRVMAESQQLADVIYERVKEHLEDIVIDDSNEDDYHLGTKGEWKPVGINTYFRLCRYEPGGHFSPHYDGEFVPSASRRSFKTVMLYLNDAFDEGTTNFIEDGHELYLDEETGKYRAQEDKILYRVKPETGMAIVFDHKMLHEGASVKNGQKYILRTEAMYQLTSRVISPLEEEFQAIVQKAQKEEALGNVKKAVELYQIASKMDEKLAIKWGLK